MLLNSFGQVCWIGANFGANFGEHFGNVVQISWLFSETSFSRGAVLIIRRYWALLNVIRRCWDSLACTLFDVIKTSPRRCCSIASGKFAESNSLRFQTQVRSLRTTPISRKNVLGVERPFSELSESSGVFSEQFSEFRDWLSECEIPFSEWHLTTWAIWKPQFSEQLTERFSQLMGTQHERSSFAPAFPWGCYKSLFSLAIASKPRKSAQKPEILQSPRKTDLQTPKCFLKIRPQNLGGMGFQG